MGLLGVIACLVVILRECFGHFGIPFSHLNCGAFGPVVQNVPTVHLRFLMIALISKGKWQSEMAHKNKVMQSINAPDGITCVDLFRRPDGSYGFDHFRRDPEDPRGWYSIGHHAGNVYASQAEAHAEALQRVPWLADGNT